MRIAALSDVHGNLRALQAVLADMDRRGRSISWSRPGTTCSRDFPRETLDLLKDRCDLLLLGNTDAYLTGEIDLATRLRPDHWKLDLLEWTKDRLGAEGIPGSSEAFPSRHCTLRKGASEKFVHANPRDLEQSLHPEAPDSILEELYTRRQRRDPGVSGHIHIPYVRKLKHVTLCNVASAGIPKDGDVRPAWTMLTYTVENR